MKNKIRNINKDLIKRKMYLKSEIKKIILLSVIHNLNIKPKIRGLANKKLLRFRLNNFISKQNNNLCLQTGRNKGVLKQTQLSRHHIKKLSLIGCLQNIKIKSW